LAQAKIRSPAAAEILVVLLEGTMIRQRALKIVLALVGLLFLAGVYPVAVDLWHANPSDTGDDMMLSLYITLGVFLLLAVHDPSAHRSLIAFTAWSSFAHAVVMSALALQPKQSNERAGFLGGSTVLVVIGLALIALTPPKRSAEKTSAVAV